MRVILKYEQDLELKNGLEIERYNYSIMIRLDINLFCLTDTKRVVMALHDDFGHLGMEKMLGLLKDRFFWPKISEHVRQHVRTCERCMRFKQPMEVS